jgi:uncharacterized protein (DUF2062 family)
MLKKWFRKRPRRRRGVHQSRWRGRLRHVREFFWPSMGHRAMARYVLLRVIRLAENPHKVALGVAVGVFVSWTPLLGLHNLLIILICWLLGASILAGLAAALVGNPWTFPLMWWGSYELGNRLLGTRHVDVVKVFEGMTLDRFWHHLWPLLKVVFLPVGLGAVPLGLVSAGLCYWLTLKLMKTYHLRRAARWAEKRARGGGQ